MPEQFNQNELQKLYIPPKDSHKGMNGKLLIIGGSELFHAASLWALSIASRIVDMVFYSSVPQNNEIVAHLKEEFRNGIVVPRDRLTNYIGEADAILIGPGLPRAEGLEKGDDNTRELTERLLKTYPNKQWIIDGGSLQVIDPSIIPEHAIVTPHGREFKTLFGIEGNETVVIEKAKQYKCTILLKGEVDIICSPEKCVKISGGNAGMTKGGTGDVLAGLVASLATKNEPFLAAVAGSFINKKAGESLYEKMGLYFNASDLVDEIPKIMKTLLY